MRGEAVPQRVHRHPLAELGCLGCSMAGPVELARRDRLARLLAGEFAGLDVVSVHGGREALQILTQGPAQVMITDLRMPEVDGFQVMDFISTNTPSTAALVITGHATTESAIEAIHNRVVDYITKPFEFDYLLFDDF
jgi:DNA-binding NtrC family response regulator